ncbi:MAG: hypothetical protein JRI40_09365 [Deltaproteobacteria bacterium]|nr:hypothetical protein [Deltaproteobacteria bacterium]MBW2081464.1 hypothetical protein [Deltaproteobacteria bacterium]
MSIKNGNTLGILRHLRGGTNMTREREYPNIAPKVARYGKSNPKKIKLFANGFFLLILFIIWLPVNSRYVVGLKIYEELHCLRIRACNFSISQGKSYFETIQWIPAFAGMTGAHTQVVIPAKAEIQ